MIQPPYGGAPTLVSLLARVQGERHDVGVVCHPRGTLAAEAAAAGARVWPVWMDRAVRPLGDARALRRLSAIIREFRPDVVHAHSSKAGVLGRVAARAGRVPVVLSPHNFAYRSYEGSAAARLAFLGVERALAPLTDYLHVVSQDEYDDAIAHGVAPPGRCVCIENGIDARPLLDLEPPRSAPPLTVGTFARLWPQKRVDLLLRAAAAADTQPFEIAIIGEGPARAELVRLAAELGLAQRTRFEPRMNARAALRELDVFVLSSSHEASPLTLMEAMAAGRPVVASAVGGIPQLVEHRRTGLVVPAGDAGALADALTELLADAALRERLGRAARDVAASRFDIRVAAERLDAVYAAAARRRAEAAN